MAQTSKTTIDGSMSEEQIDRYWKLARKAHTYGLSAAENAELRRLSRQIGGAYH